MRDVRHAEEAGFLLNRAAVGQDAERALLQPDEVEEAERLEETQAGARRRRRRIASTFDRVRGWNEQITGKP